MSKNHRWPRTAIPNDVWADGVDWDEVTGISKSEREAMLKYLVALKTLHGIEEQQQDLRRVASLGDLLGIPIDPVIRQRLKEVQAKRKTAKHYLAYMRRILARIRNGR